MNYSLQSQLAVFKTHGGPEPGDGRKPQFKPNQQLEELRNLQDRLSAEKSAWIQARDQEQRELEEKRVELLRLHVGNIQTGHCSSSGC